MINLHKELYPNMNNTDSDWEYEKENSRKNKRNYSFMEYFI